MTKAPTPDHWRSWSEARRRHRPGHGHHPGGRALGIHPARPEPSAQEPLPEFIQHLYAHPVSRETPREPHLREDPPRSEPMPKPTRRSHPSRHPQAGCAVAWYQADQWERLLELAEDREHLEATHAQWQASAENLLAQLAAQGVRARRCPVDVDTMHAWCREHGLAFDGQGRADYVSWLMTEGREG